MRPNRFSQAAPGFAEVRLSPRIHDRVGPRSVDGKFLSPKGAISSRWWLTGAGGGGAVSLSVSLPVGVRAATIVVPKPTTDGKPAAAASVKLGGTVIWDGAKLIGKPAGILGAEDQPDGAGRPLLPLKPCTMGHSIAAVKAFKAAC